MILITTRAEAVTFSNSLSDTYENMTFHGPNWTVIWHKTKKDLLRYMKKKDIFGLM